MTALTGKPVTDLQSHFAKREKEPLPLSDSDSDTDDTFHLNQRTDKGIPVRQQRQLTKANLFEYEAELELEGSYSGTVTGAGTGYQSRASEYSKEEGGWKIDTN